LGGILRGPRPYRDPNAAKVEFLTRVRELIELVEQAPHLGQVANLKQLRGGGHYYRIRIGGYRIGLTVEGDAVTFVRFLHRKDIYRYFP
jgi:mRNA interferase RelE/StbE